MSTMICGLQAKTDMIELILKAGRLKSIKLDI